MEVCVGLRKRCPKCQIILRHGVKRRICEIKKHNGRQPGPKRKSVKRIVGTMKILGGMKMAA